MANKTETITIRVTPYQKQLIADLARTLDESVAELLVNLASRKREELEEKGIEILKSYRTETKLYYAAQRKAKQEENQ